MMLNVSSGFNAACKAPSREWDCKVFMQWEFPFVDTETTSLPAKVTFANVTENTAGGSIKEQIINGITEKVYNQFGFLSTDLSDGSGNFAIEKQIAVNWNEYKKIRYVTIVGKDGEYPVDFTIRVRKIGIVNTYNTVHHMSSESAVFDLGAEYEGNSLSVLITKWSVPNAAIKLLQLSPSRLTTFTKDNIISMTVDESIENSGEVIAGSVQASSLNLILDNSNKDFNKSDSNSLYGKYMLPNRKIKPFLGVKVNGIFEYVPMGVFFSEEWIPSETEVTVTGLDYLSQFDNEQFATTLNGLNEQSFISVISEQLNNAGLSGFYNLTSFTGTTLQTTSTVRWNGSFLGNTIRDMLFYLSEFCVGFLNTGRSSGKIYLHQLYQVTPAPNFDIDKDNIFKIISANLTGHTTNFITIRLDGLVIRTFSIPTEIASNGKIEYKIDDNPYCSTGVEAEQTKNFLSDLNDTVKFKSDVVTLEWQGNPALVINDNLEYYDGILTTYLVIYSQKFEFNGGLKCTMTGRAVIL